MTEKTAVPEYAGRKKIRAYQCGICDRLTLTTFPTSGSAAPGIGPVAATLTVAGKHSKPITGRGRIAFTLKCPIRTERAIYGKI